jgi:signal peptidase II
VVDFLDFSGLYFPWIFNVADASISVGAGVLLLDQVLAGRKQPR